MGTGDMEQTMLALHFFALLILETAWVPFAECFLVV